MATPSFQCAKARDGSDLDRQFGGDEFEVNIFFCIDRLESDDDSDGSAQEGDFGPYETPRGARRSRVTVSSKIR